MNVIVHGRHLEISDKFREHVDEKIEKIERFGVAFSTIDVEVTHETNPRQADRAVEVQLTARGGGPVIRAEAAAADKYIALDLAYAHLEERVRRLAERGHRHRKAHVVKAALPFSPPPPSGEAIEQAPEVDSDLILEAGPLTVREKVHPATPMTIEQALEAMELVGHDFYMYADAESGEACVVYRRRGYDYGLIRLQG